MNNDKKEIKKHFISDPRIYKDRVTFLTDKKVDAELYAYFMQHSYGDNGKTVVYKKNLPS